MPLGTLLIAALFCTPMTLHAETAYVSDSLRLGVHAAEDQHDMPFESLAGGTPVEVVRRKGSVARVRLMDGREGWTRAADLVSTKPTPASPPKLEAHAEGLDAFGASPSAQLPLRDSGQSVATDSAAVVRGTIERLRSDSRRYEEQLEAYRQSMPLWLAGALAVIALAGGFTAGVWWIDVRIRRRHGGLRIY
jgi:hypothetical protein